MSGNEQQRVRRRNKLALAGIIKSQKSLSNFNGFPSRSSDHKSVLPKRDAQTVLSELKSQEDLFTSYYRPIVQKHKSGPIRSRCSELTTRSTGELCHIGLTTQSTLRPLSKEGGQDVRSSIKSGRVSQLAGFVERLVIQDKSRVPVSSSGSSSSCDLIEAELNSSTRVSLNMGSLCNAKAKSNNELPNCTNEVNSKPWSSPWYRHCRPRAPLPVLHTVNSNDNSKTFETSSPNHGIAYPCCLNNHGFVEPYQSSCSSAEDHLESASTIAYNHDRVSSNNSVDTVLAMHRLDPHVLEIDVSQENINWDSDFTLPPPPTNFVTLPVDEFAETDQFYSFPSPPLNRIGTSADGSNDMRTMLVVGASSTRHSEQTSLKPLASITNILPNHGSFGRRHPKWAIDRHSELHRSNFGARSQSSAFGLDTEINSSPPVPSPPPLITERLPPEPYPVQLRNIQTYDQDYPEIPILARPTVLKREAPDGAEFTSNKSEVTSETKRISMIEDTFSPALKRNPKCELSVDNYSPKKSRMHLLLPSERSAFLPVGSARQLHRVSSPCIR